jgi:hypothetical protein
VDRTTARRHDPGRLLRHAGDARAAGD